MSRSPSSPSFWRSAFTVLAGVGIAQLVPLLTSLVLAVALGAEEFGFFSLWLGLVYLGAVVSTLRLENALFIENQGRSRELSLVAVVQIVIISAVIAAAFFTVFRMIGKGLLLPVSDGLFFALIPAAALLAINVSAQAFVVANGNFSLVNKLRISQALSVALAQCLLVWRESSAASMALGFMLGQVICMVYAWLAIWTQTQDTSGGLSCSRFVKRHWRFPVFSLPADALSSFGALLPVALIGARYGPDAAGQIALTIRVLATPIGLVAKAIQDVFKRQAPQDIKLNGSCRKLYLNILLGLFPVMLVFASALMWIAPAAFVFLFGQEWAQAGQMARTLAPVYALSLAASPLSYIVYLVNKQYVDLIWQAVLVVGVWSSLTYGPELTRAITSYTVTYVLMYLIYLAISYRLCAYPRHKTAMQ